MCGRFFVVILFLPALKVPFALVLKLLSMISSLKKPSWDQQTSSHDGNN